MSVSVACFRSKDLALLQLRTLAEVLPQHTTASKRHSSVDHVTSMVLLVGETSLVLTQCVLKVALSVSSEMRI